MKSSKNKILAAVLLALVAGAGCFRSRGEREWQYMPDMYRSPAIKAQEADPEAEGASQMRVPPAGTVPATGIIPYQIPAADTIAAAAQINPLPVTEEVLAVGKKYFYIYCIVCHGPLGAGDGYIVPKLPKPPELYSEKVRSWTDGRIFHTITNGQGNMPSYRSSIDPNTRWAIIHYLRAIQRAKNPTVEDLADFSRLQSTEK